MKRHAPINVLFYHPRDAIGKEILAQRVAAVHANTVTRHISDLPCPVDQKLALLDAVLASANQRSTESYRGSRVPEQSEL